MRRSKLDFLGPWGRRDLSWGGFCDWCADLFVESAVVAPTQAEWCSVAAVTALHFSLMADFERSLEVAEEIPLEIAA